MEGFPTYVRAIFQNFDGSLTYIDNENGILGCHNNIDGSIELGSLFLKLGGKTEAVEVEEDRSVNNFNSNRIISGDLGCFGWRQYIKDQDSTE